MQPDNLSVDAVSQVKLLLFRLKLLITLKTLRQTKYHTEEKVLFWIGLTDLAKVSYAGYIIPPYQWRVYLKKKMFLSTLFLIECSH